MTASLTPAEANTALNAELNLKNMKLEKWIGIIKSILQRNETMKKLLQENDLKPIIEQSRTANNLNSIISSIVPRPSKLKERIDLLSGWYERLADDFVHCALVEPKNIEQMHGQLMNEDISTYKLFIYFIMLQTKDLRRIFILQSRLLGNYVPTPLPFDSYATDHCTVCFKPLFDQRKVTVSTTCNHIIACTDCTCTKCIYCDIDITTVTIFV